MKQKSTHARGPTVQYVPSNDEMQALRDACRDRKDRLVLYVLAGGGFRVGEFVHIRPSWVNEKRGTVTIPYMDDGWTAKTKKSARLVPLRRMDRGAWDVLMDFMRDEGRIPFGAVMAHRRVKRLGDRVGIYLFPHALRGYCATKWGVKLRNSRILMRIMGWSRLSTAEQYCGVTDEDVERAITEERLREEGLL